MESDENKTIHLKANKTDNNKKRVLEALKKTLGIVTAACEAANISRTQFYEWMKTDAEFKAAVDDVDEMQLDFVESKNLQNIKEGDVASIIFYLKTKGKKRGYGEKQELAHNFGNTFSGFTVTIKNDHD